MICELLSRLETRQIRQAVEEILLQSAFACEAGNGSEMLKLAQMARRVSIACGDDIGEAVSLTHVGVAQAQLGAFVEATRAFQKAQRIFHRVAALEQRHNEGLALFGQALVHAMRRPRNRVLAIASYQNAVDLFEELYSAYETAGDNKRCREIYDLVADLRVRMLSEIPKIYIDAGDFAAPNLLREPPISVEDGLSDSMVSRDPNSEMDQSAEIVDGVGWVIGPEQRRTKSPKPAEKQPGDNRLPGSFVRDDSGNVSYIDSDPKEPG
jgi:hypothetical protein